MAKPKLILDMFTYYEGRLAERVYLTQPVGDDKVIDYTWKQTLDQSRRMALHQSPRPGARSTCCHFVQELRTFFHGRAGHLDGGLHHGCHFPYRDG